MTNRQILVIDNEPLVQEAAKISLEMVAKWQVITASSGAEGLVKAEREKPNAILLDLMMPGMDGISTLQKLQANSVTQPIPVILLTATVQPSDVPYYQTLGFRGAIAKPFEPLRFAEEIAQILEWKL
ncbi:response regulator [Leptolyngbya sp. AN03gr2]|uniref:response regulator n=1 Tax=unclassified Leptolyngbya TaxID=2650499 RepID=UPI003D317DA2